MYQIKTLYESTQIIPQDGNTACNQQGRNASASAAARATNSLFLSMTTDPSEQHSYAALWTIWSRLFNFIKQIPAEHPALQRLVDWIVELRKLEVQTLHIWNRDIELWTELPLLGPEWLEWVEEYYVHPEDGKSSRFKPFAICWKRTVATLS